MTTAVVALLWIALILFARKTESKETTRRHVELFKQAIREELHQIQLEKLATPGGEFKPLLVELADTPASKTGAKA